MEKKETEKETQSGEKKRAETDDFFDAARKFADKAEDYANKTGERIHSSEFFNKMTSAFKKMSDYMEEKSDEFQKGDAAKKLDLFMEKTVAEADKLFKKAKDAGRDMADEVDEAIDSVREKIKGKR